MYHSLVPITHAHVKPGETCTVTVTAAGTKCGEPGVTAFTTARGRYVECALHAVATPRPEPELRVGARVGITHYGKGYAGVVTHIARTRVEVRFTTRGGKAKTMFFPMTEVRI